MLGLMREIISTADVFQRSDLGYVPCSFHPERSLVPTASPGSGLGMCSGEPHAVVAGHASSSRLGSRISGVT